MLLDVEVARQPGEVVPVAHLVEHLGPAGLLRLVPAAAAIVVGEERQHLADRTVVDAPDGLAEAVVVAEAQAGDDREPLRRGQLAALEHGVDAGGVDGHRLLGEDVLAGLDRRAEVDRPEVRRRAEQDHVDPAAQQLAVGVEPDEAAAGATSSLAAIVSFFRRVSRLFSSRSSKASAMATSRTFDSAASACAAAPVPRSPQPIRPTRRMSLPAACTCGRAARVPAAAVAFEEFDVARRIRRSWSASSLLAGSSDPARTDAGLARPIGPTPPRAYQPTPSG